MNDISNIQNPSMRLLRPCEECNNEFYYSIIYNKVKRKYYIISDIDCGIYGKFFPLIEGDVDEEEESKENERENIKEKEEKESNNENESLKNDKREESKMESEKEKEKEKEEIEKNENIIEENEKQIEIDNTIESTILYTDISENICLE